MYFKGSFGKVELWTVWSSFNDQHPLTTENPDLIAELIKMCECLATKMVMLPICYKLEKEEDTLSIWKLEHLIIQNLMH